MFTFSLFISRFQYKSLYLYFAERENTLGGKGKSYFDVLYTQHICAVMGDAERLLASQAEIDNVLDNVEVRRPPTSTPTPVHRHLERIIHTTFWDAAY